MIVVAVYWFDAYRSARFRLPPDQKALTLVRERIDPTSPLSTWKVETDKETALARVEAYNRSIHNKSDLAAVVGYCPGEYRVSHASQNWRVNLNKNGTSEVAVQEVHAGGIDLYEDTQGKCLDGSSKTYAPIGS